MTNKLLYKLNNNLAKNPKEFFNALGGLHDSKIKIITIDIINSNIKLLIDDLYANFINLPKYKDCKNIFLLIEFDKLDINLDHLNKEEISVYDIEINKDLLKILTSPSGYIKVNFKDICFSFKD